MKRFLSAFAIVARDNHEAETRDPVHRFLRWVSIFSIFPAIGFLIPYGIVAKRVFPTVGLVPIFLSACSGVLQLLHKAGTRRTSFCMDLTIAALIALCYVPGIISVRFPRYWGRTTDVIGYTIAGLYGTVPLILNLCIHAFFVLRETYFGDAVGWVSTPTPTCAYCQRHVCSKRSASSSDPEKESHPHDGARSFPHTDTQSLCTDGRSAADEEDSDLIPQQAEHSRSGTYTDNAGPTTIMSTTCYDHQPNLERMTLANGSTASGWTGVIRWLDDVTRKPVRGDEWRSTGQPQTGEV